MVIYTAKTVSDPSTYVEDMMRWVWGLQSTFAYMLHCIVMIHDFEQREHQKVPMLKLIDFGMARELRDVT